VAEERLPLRLTLADRVRARARRVASATNQSCSFELTASFAVFVLRNCVGKVDKDAEMAPADEEDMFDF
jgi:hypothetical protein